MKDILATHFKDFSDLTSDQLQIKGVKEDFLLDRLACSDDSRLK